MTQTFSFRDVEKLSAYLDGQLKPSEIAHLETRLQTDPQLASALKELRQARGLLRQLPQRRAPRNFTLTPKMVGIKPPMPRAYPLFNYSTALATLFLLITFATNFMAPRIVRIAVPYGIGGYGGGCDAGCTEPELAMEAAPPAPAGGGATADDSARVEPTMRPNGVEKSAPGQAYTQVAPPQPDGVTQKRPAPPIGLQLQITLAGIAILSAIIALFLRYTEIRKWRAKAK